MRELLMVGLLAVFALDLIACTQYEVIYGLLASCAFGTAV